MSSSSSTIETRWRLSFNIIQPLQPQKLFTESWLTKGLLCHTNIIDKTTNIIDKTTNIIDKTTNIIDDTTNIIDKTTNI